jgi:hypothetical protein
MVNNHSISGEPQHQSNTTINNWVGYHMTNETMQSGRSGTHEFAYNRHKHKHNTIPRSLSDVLRVWTT